MRYIIYALKGIYIMRPIFLIFLFILTNISGKSQESDFALGINLCGGEFSENNLPGNLNEHYAYPTAEEVDYFYKKGFKMVTIPFRWERIQKSLGGDLDYQEIGEIKKVVTWCSNKGLKVILSMHNGGRYKKYGIEYIIGSYAVSRQDFSDVWNKLANAFSGYQNLYGFEIMTEPHEMQGFDWFTTAQEAIHSIRQADSRNHIIISGENYAAAESWQQYSDQLKFLKDPQDKLIYNAHCYFDIDFTGKYFYSYEQNQVDDQTGVNRVTPFVNWLKENNKKGMIGEFGVPDTDPRWLKVMEQFLKYLNSNKVTAVYWASGKKWSGAPLSVYPLAQNDRPQMTVLQQFTTSNAYEEKPSINVVADVPESTKNNTTAPIQLVAAPPPPPESFLFLPGTVLLPQPNGGLYKPTLPLPTQTQEKVVSRLAKYRN